MPMGLGACPRIPVRGTAHRSLALSGSRDHSGQALCLCPSLSSSCSCPPLPALCGRIPVPHPGSPPCHPILTHKGWMLGTGERGEPFPPHKYSVCEIQIVPFARHQDSWVPGSQGVTFGGPSFFRRTSVRWFRKHTCSNRKLTTSTWSHGLTGNGTSARSNVNRFPYTLPKGQGWNLSELPRGLGNNDLLLH